RQRAEAQRIAGIADLSQRQAADIDDSFGRRKPGLPKLQKIRPACDIGCAAPCSLRERVVEMRGADVMERRSAHSPATSAIAATMLGCAPQRQRLPLMPSRICAIEPGFSASSAMAERIWPGVQ